MEMNLIDDLRRHLLEMEVDWHLCGGFAIDVYLGRPTRKHKDIDITVSFEDLPGCIDYLKSKGWEIDAPVGGQRLVPVETALKSRDLSFDNIWCCRKDAGLIRTVKQEGIYRYVEFPDREQTELDYIEVLFNKVEKGIFYYGKNHEIKRDAGKAFIQKGKFSILAPEIILLYKSRNHEKREYQMDFDRAVHQLEKERYDWLLQAMNVEYPEGHPWLDRIENESGKDDQDV